MWYNKYVGIPYVELGRDLSGLDCWGLACVVYKDEFGVELPKFVGTYTTTSDQAGVEQLILTNRDGWELVQEPVPGDLICFRILGFNSHIGIYIGDNKFIHARQGVSSVVIESVTSTQWQHRVEGYYRYTKTISVPVTSAPHPLRWERFQDTIPEGSTIQDMVTHINKTHGISSDIRAHYTVILDGKVVHELDWASTPITANNTVEYRAIAQGGAARQLLMLAVVIAASIYAPGIADTVFGEAVFGSEVGATTTLAASKGFVVATQVGLTMAGMALVNAIAPIRPENETDREVQQARRANLFGGGSNQANLYGAIPVVLGRMRITPPLGAKQWVDFIDNERSYLNSLVVWGFGPLRVSDIQIGTDPLTNYADYKISTVSGYSAEDTSSIDSIYGSDIDQQVVNQQLVNIDATQNPSNIGQRGGATQLSRTSNLVTATTTSAHGFTTGDLVSVVATDTTFNVSQLAVTVTGTNTFTYTKTGGNTVSSASVYSGQALNPWQTVQLTQDSDRLGVAIHFPEGLRKLYTKGAQAGEPAAAPFTASIEWRRIDAAGTALADWVTGAYRSYKGFTTRIGPVYYGYSVPGTWNPETGSYTYNNVSLYQWIKVGVNDSGEPLVIYGMPSEAQNTDASTQLQQHFLAQGYGSTANKSTSRIPYWTQGTLLWTFCTFGGAIVQSIDNRANLGTSAGFGYTTSATYRDYYDYDNGSMSSVATGETDIVISAGSIGTGTTNLNAGGISLAIGAENQEFFKKKDAFTYVLNIQGIQKGRYEVRVKRTNFDTADPTGQDVRNYHTSILYTVTGYSNQKPIQNPPGCQLAKTAISILASENVNGRLEGINGVVQTICFDYDGNTWTTQRTTSNPASLFLYVLTHPANLFRITDSEYSSKVDLAAFTQWHNYCSTQGFEYNGVLDAQRSVMDVLKDIASAGRASPMIIDGRWSVIIDKQRTSTIQHFTPYNSWGFESTKVLPRRPHAFRVVFKNEERGYQDDEIIVPNEGYTAQTATFIEQITLPGITNRAIAAKHARFHLAQLKLRPEIYTLSTDFEYLVCNRGDLVKVTHDVPQWGLGYGRIKSVTSSTEFVLDQPVYLEAGKTYKLRVRTATGTSVDSNLTAIATTQEYSTITITTALASVAADNLFMLGELGKEAQDLIVLSVEPSGNTTARLTLVDYSSDIYSVDTNTLPASSPFTIPKYNTNITLTPEKLIDSITNTPVIVQALIKSDESVLTRNKGGGLVSNIRVPFKNPEGLSKIAAYIEAQYDFSTSAPTQWQFKYMESLASAGGSITLPDVQDTEIYKIRLRYWSDTGITGPWSSVFTHQVVGKTSPPSNVTGATSSVDRDTGLITLTWTAVEDPDFSYYEVRGQGDQVVVFSGFATTCKVQPYAGVGSSNTYYIRAYDVVGNASAQATQITPTIAAPATPVFPGTFDADLFAQSTLTDSIYTFTWLPGTPPQNSLRVDKYIVTLITPSTPPKTINTTTNSLSWQTNTSWVGAATLKVQAVDILGNLSSEATRTVTKYLPNQPSNPSVTPVGTNIRLDWEDNQKTSLPVVGYEIRTSDSGWGSSGSVWRGSVSTADIDLKGKTAGTYTWYLAAFDSDAKYSSARPVTYTIASPPQTIIDNPVFQDTSLTNATVTLSWEQVYPVFGLYGYEVSWTYPVKGTNPQQYATETVITQANTITVQGNWTGSAEFSIKTIDNLLTSTTSNMSTAATKTVSIQIPNPISTTEYRAQVVDNNVLLTWVLPAPTTFPIAFVRIKKGGTNWQNATLIGDKSGTFTTFSELAAGIYIYRIAVVDTEGNESASIELTRDVNQPPDYVFNKEFISTFSGTKTNSFIDTQTNYLILPANLTETWQQHYSTRGWTSAQSQIDAGYPIYVQPGSTYSGSSEQLATASYVETFDYQAALAGSQVTLVYGGSVLAGTLNVNTKIEYSLDQSTWTSYENTSVIIANNFRYIRITITVTQITAGALYQISNLSVRLDSKEVKDAGSGTAYSADTNGTIVNFNKGFIDITSINVSLNTTQPYFVVYDFKDSNYTGTYSKNGTTGILTLTLDYPVTNIISSTNSTVTSTGNGTVTVITNSAHGLVSGNLVKIVCSSNSAFNTTGYQTITVVSSTSFTYVKTATGTSVQALAYLSITHLFGTGQKLRISFSNSEDLSAQYLINSLTDNQLTIQAAAGQTFSGANYIFYPNSARIFVYNTSGVRQNNIPITWAVQGY